jgi:membrane protease subunit HflK
MFSLRFLILITVLIWLSSGIVIIRPGERAVVQRFGAIVAHPYPGLWISFPWGIDRVERFSVQEVRHIAVGYDPAWEEADSGQFLTADHNLVQLQLAVHYVIGESDSDLDAYVAQRAHLEKVLQRLCEVAVAEWVGTHDVDKVLLTGNALLPIWVQERLQQYLPVYQLGIHLQQIHVVWLTPPEEVRPAFAAVTQAQAAVGIQLLQARQQAEQRQRQAQALAYRLEQQAEAFRQTLLQQTEAEIQQLQTLRQTLGNSPDQLALFWWQELQQTLQELKNRGGRVEPIDPQLHPQGLDLIHLLRLRDTPGR